MNLVNTTIAKLSILPLLLFVAVFLGVGIYFESVGVDYAFYQVPAPIAIIPAIILAFCLHRGRVSEKVEVFVKGIGHSNIITMCLIYLLAGAFSTVASATGGVDAVVNAGLSLVSANFLLPGIFIISAIVATAMGTSMGTIGAIAPIALAVSTKAGIDLNIMAGAVISGAMFGDNLSIISDTTIAATRSQGCNMKDKFKENFNMSLIAAIITMVILFFFAPSPESIEVKDFNLILAIPYFFILLLAILGVNVFVVLFAGILIAGVIGMMGDYTFLAFTKDIYKGFSSMQEIFLLSLLIGGLSEFIREGGGLEYISKTIQSLTKIVSKWSEKIADQLGIALLVSITNLCVANNTVSIIIVGPIAKKLAASGEVSAKRSASVLDIFSCITQGLLPYGAQALLLGASFKIAPIEVVTSSYYCVTLFFVALSFIFFRKS
ncbi:sodium:proton antiporter [Halobacteriovorax marinus]|uniref:Na+/H+ antiporter NhaC family protein n=1 Tax=Halobacteriovorax marinus TaxID=97084 RepID=UPI000BC334E8|nr:Na+/H+ antiporter NhaC family protein [Halobacteriovorax marinus]ATH09120.1 sodium:proton antiporter [Halobacteriovorax marinus]